MVTLFLLTLWLASLTIGNMWAAGFVATPKFDPKPYLHRAFLFLILTSGSLIVFVGLMIHTWRYKKKLDSK